MEVLGEDGRIILKLITEDMDWIHLVQDRVLWHHLVNTVMNLCIP